MFLLFWIRDGEPPTASQWAKDSTEVSSVLSAVSPQSKVVPDLQSKTLKLNPNTLENLALQDGNVSCVRNVWARRFIPGSQPVEASILSSVKHSGMTPCQDFINSK